MSAFDLLVIGEINPDLIISGPDVTPAFGQAEKLVETATLTIGSSSVITACGAARLGLKTAFIGVVGDDELGRFILEQMRLRGLDISACLMDPDVSTGLGLILSQPSDRAILTYPGAIPLLRLDQVDRGMLSRARHLHTGSYFLLEKLRPDLPHLFAEAHRLGLTTSLDTNWDPQEQWQVDALLPHCDLFLPNEMEALRITRSRKLDEALAVLAAQVRVLAVKLGPAGGIAIQQRETVRHPALSVDVVDTTGAGDSFNAGFLYGYLHGWPLGESLRLACACGSLSTRSLGGTTAQPSLAQVQQHVRLSQVEGRRGKEENSGFKELLQ